MQFRKNEEAVSPVIGVILMVAITVILAAVIAAFVFGMGPPKQAPQASLRATSVTITTNDVKVEHQGGSDIILSDAKIIVEQGSNRVQWATAGNSSTRMVAGDKLELYTSGAYNVTLNGVYMSNGSFTGTAYSTVTGQEVMVTVVDIPSGQQIAQMKIRA